MPITLSLTPSVLLQLCMIYQKQHSNSKFAGLFKEGDGGDRLFILFPKCYVAVEFTKVSHFAKTMFL